METPFDNFDPETQRDVAFPAAALNEILRDEKKFQEEIVSAVLRDIDHAADLPALEAVGRELAALKVCGWLTERVRRSWLRRRSEIKERMERDAAAPPPVAG